MDKTNETQLMDAAGIVYLTPDNSSFKKNGDFLAMMLKSDETKDYDRVNLHRMFPYDKPYNYISVLNSESEEIGLIIDIGDFDSDTQMIIKDELNRKYYVCSLSSVVSVRDKFGFSYWKTRGIDGEITFTIKDVHSSIRLDGEGNIMISDIDGNRYILPSFDSLDKKSRKLVELYL